MTEWNNDEISKLMDFIEKRSSGCSVDNVIRHFLVQETVINLGQIFRASFW